MAERTGFPAATLRYDEELARLVAAEQRCCQFFRFAITVDSRGVTLEIAAPPEASPIVHSLFGAPDRASGVVRDQRPN